MTEKKKVNPKDIARGLGRDYPPTAEQSEVITADLAPQLVVAGAGSGKTETMAYRVLWLIANGLVSPEQILGVTFTKKAATELSERVLKGISSLELNEDFAVPTISTYHSYAQNLVSEFGSQLGVESQAEPMGETERWMLVRKIVQEYDGNTEDVTSAVSTLCEKVLQFSGQCAEHLIEPAEVIEYLQNEIVRYESLPSIPGVYEGRKPSQPADSHYLQPLKERLVIANMAQEYEDAKRINGVIDFGDLIKLAAEISRNVPTAGETQKEKFKVVLLDEFQDTSYGQIELFQQLFGKEHALTAVGDPNQSIYGWRGASSGGMGRFAHDFKSEEFGDVPVRSLSTSWRNESEILLAANKIVEPLEVRGLDLPKLQPKPNSAPGKVYQARFVTSEEEAEFIADFTKEQWDSSSENRKSIAILCRAKSSFPTLEEALTVRGVPCQILGLAGLMSTPEVVDLVSMLKILDNPDEPSALMRVLMGARWQIGARDLKELKTLASSRVIHQESRKERQEAYEAAAPGEFVAETADESSLVETILSLEWLSEEKVEENCQLSKEGYKRLKDLSSEMHRLQEMQDLELPEYVFRVMKEMRLDLEMKVVSEESRVALRHLYEFMNVVKEFYRREAGSLTQFLAWLEIAEVRENGLEMPESEAQKDAVQLTTVHSAKGLEWDIVIVPQLMEDSFPTKPKTTDWVSDSGAIPWPLRGDKNDMPNWDPQSEGDQYSLVKSYQEKLKEPSKDHYREEERRLAYVAFTRARELLMLTSTVFKGKGKTKHSISRFLGELELPEESTLRWVSDEEAPDVNPALEKEEIVSQWPFDVLGERREAVDTAVSLVEQADMSEGFTDPRIKELYQNYRDIVKKQKQDRPTNDVPLPPRLSASQIVELKKAPEQLASRLRRPMPFKPNPRASRGSAFHEWAENFYKKSGMSLFDELENEETEESAEDVEKLIKKFEKSPWAQKQPVSVEDAIELSLDQVSIPGRIDAVFQDPDDPEGYVLVDWKTGRIPTGGDMEAATLQLAIYRLAYSQLHDIPVDKIKACFYYVSDDKEIYVDELATQEDLEEIVRSGINSY